MILKTDNPRKFLLIIETNSADWGLSKEEVHVSLVVTESGVIRWVYLYHQGYERTTMLSPWAKTKTQRWGWTEWLRTMIKSQVIAQISGLIVELEGQDQVVTETDIPTETRRQLLMYFITTAAARMFKPKVDQLPKIIVHLREKSQMRPAAFAKAVGISYDVLYNAESSRNGLSPTNLARLQVMSQRLNEWYITDFLESEIGSGKLRRMEKGGKL